MICEDSLNHFYSCFQITYQDFDFQLINADMLKLLENKHGYPPRFTFWCTSSATNSATSFITTLTLQLSTESNADTEKYNFHFAIGRPSGRKLCIYVDNYCILLIREGNIENFISHYIEKNIAILLRTYVTYSKNIYMEKTLANLANCNISPSFFANF